MSTDEVTSLQLQSQSMLCQLEIALPGGGVAMNAATEKVSRRIRTERIAGYLPLAVATGERSARMPATEREAPKSTSKNDHVRSNIISCGL